MNEILIKNLPWLISSVLGFIIWLLRLEGVTKINKQAQDSNLQALKELMESELEKRDAEIQNVRETTRHLTRMGEDIKGTLGPLLQSVAAMDAKLDILISEHNKKQYHV